MKYKLYDIERKYDFNQRYGGKHCYQEAQPIGEYVSFTPAKIQSFTIMITSVQPVRAPFSFQCYTKPPRVPVELNPELLKIPVESSHEWRRFHRELRTDSFQCKKCGVMASRVTGIRPHPKSYPDCDSAVILQVILT